MIKQFWSLQEKYQTFGALHGKDQTIVGPTWKGTNIWDTNGNWSKCFGPYMEKVKTF